MNPSTLPIIAIIISLISIAISAYSYYLYVSNKKKFFYKYEGIEYIIHPELKNKEDLFYTGAGTTWGTDVNGKRYRKIYNPRYMDSEFDNCKGKVKPGDYVTL